MEGRPKRRRQLLFPIFSIDLAAPDHGKLLDQSKWSRFGFLTTGITGGDGFAFWARLAALPSSDIKARWLNGYILLTCFVWIDLWWLAKSPRRLRFHFLKGPKEELATRVSVSYWLTGRQNRQASSMLLSKNKITRELNREYPPGGGFLPIRSGWIRPNSQTNLCHVLPNYTTSILIAFSLDGR